MVHHFHFDASSYHTIRLFVDKKITKFINFKIRVRMIASERSLNIEVLLVLIKLTKMTFLEFHVIVVLC